MDMTLLATEILVQQKRPYRFSATLLGYKAHENASGRTHRAPEMSGGSCVICNAIDTKTSRVISWKQIILKSSFEVGVGYKLYLYVAQRPLCFPNPFTIPLKHWTR